LLTELGLTLNQAKIYIANLQTGQATAKTIAQTSKVAREDVYRTLSSLQILGLVIKHLTKPTIYEAVKPKDAIASLIKRKEKEHIKRLEKADQALKEIVDFENCCKLSSVKDESIVLVTNDENDHIVINEAKQVNSTLDFTTRYNLFLHSFNSAELNILLKEMHKAMKRGVKMRMLMDLPEGKKNVSELSFHVPLSNAIMRDPNFEYRYMAAPLECIIIVYDDNKALIETSSEHDIYLSPFLWSNNKVLVTLCRKYFEVLWNAAVVPKKDNF
jgi:sugar-specific transcriptional regulator TrmB